MLLFTEFCLNKQQLGSHFLGFFDQNFGEIRSIANRYKKSNK
ncbi:hypothetical protein J699_03252 [Acinetobacter sp. 1000160]|nr:hypothetical protein J537_2428 [Acinetobacter baumannii 1437282]EXB49576.1 hypothetical protein J522_1161 [Acinetobacter baumannii 146457]EYT15777.1 hypothetical protein J699_03252 [Acinetobacter sp. 1000160]